MQNRQGVAWGKKGETSVELSGAGTQSSNKEKETG